jgi:hypothetical protein
MLNWFVSIQSGGYYVILSFIPIKLGSHILRHNKLVTKRRHTSINDTLLMMISYWCEYPFCASEEKTNASVYPHLGQVEKWGNACVIQLFDNLTNYGFH